MTELSFELVSVKVCAAIHFAGAIETNNFVKRFISRVCLTDRIIKISNFVSDLSRYSASGAQCS